MSDREMELKGEPATLDKYRARKTYGEIADEHWDRFRAVSRGWFKWVIKIGTGEHTVGRYFDELAAMEAAADLRTAFLDGAFLGVNVATEKTADEYREALAKARATNRRLQRRVQVAEGPSESYKQQIAYVEHLSGQRWLSEFKRVTSAHRELKEIFLELAQVYEYPQGAQKLHSVMDSNMEAGTKREIENGAVYANCFIPDSEQTADDIKRGNTRVRSFRVVDEVKRLVADFIAMRDKKDDPAQELAGKLIDAACEANGGQITWEKAIDITATTTKMSDAERDRLLAYGMNEGKLDRLKVFYNVDTIEELIDAQSNHIEKLQERVRQAGNELLQPGRSPREG